MQNNFLIQLQNPTGGMKSKDPNKGANGVKAKNDGKDGLGSVFTNRWTGQLAK